MHMVISYIFKVFKFRIELTLNNFLFGDYCRLKLLFHDILIAIEISKNNNFLTNENY
jgi:hypothetical protein